MFLSSFCLAGPAVRVAGVLCLVSPWLAASEVPAAERRLQVVRAVQEGEAALPLLTEALADPDPLVRRAAVRNLKALGRPAQAALKIAEEDADALLRRTALLALLENAPPAKAAEVIRRGLEDPDPMVRQALEEAARNPQRLARLADSGDSLVARIAGDAMAGSPDEVRSARMLPAFEDFHLDTLREISLVEAPWKFRPDPKEIGLEEGWAKPDYDDAAWRPIGIDRSWTAQGVEELGVAWYRCRFTLPEKPECDAVDLTFDGVDEVAHIWVNGHDVGRHDLGAEGWNRRFSADVTEFLKWGGENGIAVRVVKRSGKHAGIHQPVYLEILKK
ncbi:MAG TPA: HEAT repeat domain-containing protein [Chthoniobacteraceae bacterium]|nr:HEAT repeat domain-containing protein [Chthoniobacteraceae bacterium]